MQKFEPIINKTLFAQRILEIQENEGNDATVVSTIKEKLKETNGESVYEQFMRICSLYNVGFYGVEKQDEIEKYRVTVTVNNYDSRSLKYADKNLDISNMLAEALYGELAAMIKNEEYFRNRKV